METQQIEKLKERIKFFAQKADENAEAYQDFLVLVAQPLLFSTDFLYKLWLNFKGYKQKDPKKQPSYLVVSDFILSSLCQPIGTDLFRMEDEIREHLLSQTTKQIRTDVASFIEEYAIRNKSNLSKNVFEIHSLFAKGVLYPSEMEKEIIEKLKSESNPNEKANYLNLYFNSLPFGENGTQKAGISLVRVDNPNEENVLKLGYLPKGIEGNLGKGNELKSQKDEGNIRVEGATITSYELFPEKVRKKSIKIIGSTIENVSIYSNVDRIIISNSSIKKLHLSYNHGYKITIENCKIEGLQIDVLEIDNLIIDSTSIEIITASVARISKATFVNSKIIKESISQLHIEKFFIEKTPIHNNALFLGINGIVELSLLNNNSNEIDFIEKYKNSLTSLIIRENSVEDISMLKDFILSKIDLYDNSISDISCLSSLINLTSANIAGNQISDISPLFNLVNLISLNIGYNRISDISFLSELKKLEYLNISFNQISDISPILELPNLKELYLKGNPIENIPKDIYDIDGNCLEGVREYFKNDKAVFQQQKQEQAFFSNTNSILSLLQINSKNKSPILDLSNSDIHDINTEIPILFECTHLEVLKLQNNEITHFPLDLFDKLSKLKILFLKGNPIKNLPNKIYDTDGNCFDDVKNFISNINLIKQKVIERNINEATELYEQNLIENMPSSNLADLSTLKDQFMAGEIMNNYYFQYIFDKLMLQGFDINSFLIEDNEIYTLYKLTEFIEKGEISLTIDILDRMNIENLIGKEYFRTFRVIKSDYMKSEFYFDYNRLKVFILAIEEKIDEEYYEDYEVISQQELISYIEEVQMDKAFLFLMFLVDDSSNESFKEIFESIRVDYLYNLGKYNIHERLIVLTNEIYKERGKNEITKKNTSYGTEKEIEGLTAALDLLLEKKDFLLTEKAITVSAEEKFSLIKQIESYEEDIKGYRQKIEELQIENPNNSELNDLDNKTQKAQEKIEESLKKTNQKSVFISYNYKNKELATKIKEVLIENNIDVLIDSETMKAGEDIKTFTERCIKESDFILCLVSKNGLLSTGLALESVLVFADEKIKSNKKIIALYEDDSLFSEEFLKESILKIRIEKQEIANKIAEIIKEKLSSEHLQEEYNRYQKLETTLVDIIERLRNSLCIDVSEENFEIGMQKLIKDIKE